MSLVNLKEQFLRLSELVRDDIRPVILDIATDLLYEFEHHRITMAEIRTTLNHVSSRIAIAIASAIDDLWANESLELAKREEHTRLKLQQLRESVEQIEHHLTRLDQRLDDYYHAIESAVAVLQSSNRQEDDPHA